MVDVDGTEVVANYRQSHNPSWSACLRVGGHTALSLHSPDELGELTQWLWPS